MGGAIISTLCYIFSPHQGSFHTAAFDIVLDPRYSQHQAAKPKPLQKPVGTGASTVYAGAGKSMRGSVQGMNNGGGRSAVVSNNSGSTFLSKFDKNFRSYMNKFDRAVNMTCGWIIGDNGDESYKNDDIANAFRNADGIVKARDDYYDRDITHHHVAFGLKGLFQAGLDPIEQFVGSYDYRIDVVGKNLQYTITNSTTFGSAAYHIWPYKWNWINGPMGTLNQTYIFTEPRRPQK